LGTVFGYSSTCDPTIISGKMPHEHGHFSFFAYNPEKSPFAALKYLSILPKFLTRRGRVRRQLSKLIQRYYGYTGYFQIYGMPFDLISLFDYTEKRDLYQPGGMNYGVPTIFDYLRENKVPFHLSDWRISEEKNLKTLHDSISEGKIVFSYLYMAAMDAILHRDGTFAESVTKKIKWYEARLREVMKHAEEKYEDVRLFIFTDHGMTDTIDNCDLISRIDRLGLKFGEDYAAMYDSTIARFWIIKDSARDPIINALNNEPKGQILSEEKLDQYGCNFPQKEYGDIFFMMNPGTMIVPSFMGEVSLAGMHGYDPHHKDSVASFSSNTVPAVMPKRLDDLYGLMKGEISHHL
jgi:predicted AlkP superfamily pyrophosphatase or phosphodiesterase